jgi:hypothetical protein
VEEILVLQLHPDELPHSVRGGEHPLRHALVGSEQLKRTRLHFRCSQSTKYTAFLVSLASAAQEFQVMDAPFFAFQVLERELADEKPAGEKPTAVLGSAS